MMERTWKLLAVMRFMDYLCLGDQSSPFLCGKLGDVYEEKKSDFMNLFGYHLDCSLFFNHKNGGSKNSGMIHRYEIRIKLSLSHIPAPKK